MIECPEREADRGRIKVRMLWGGPQGHGVDGVQGGEVAGLCRLDLALWGTCLKAAVCRLAPCPPLYSSQGFEDRTNFMLLEASLFQSGIRSRDSHQVQNKGAVVDHSS